MATLILNVGESPYPLPRCYGGVVLPVGGGRTALRTKAQVVSDLGGTMPRNLRTQIVPDAQADLPFSTEEWMESVLDRDLATPPAAPALGARYLVATSPTGLWVGHANDVAEWNGASWDFTAPDTDAVVTVEDEVVRVRYSGTAWVLDTTGASISDWTPVRHASAAALPAYTRVGNVITANANGAIAGHASVDGYDPSVGDRFLLRHGAAGADNGIYSWTAVGAAGSPFVLTRAGDANASEDFFSGKRVLAVSGTLGANRTFGLTTTGAITLNTTALAFAMTAALGATAGGRAMVADDFLAPTEVADAAGGKFAPWAIPAIHRGACASATCPIAANPADAETLTIDGHEFRFMAVLVGAQAYTQVLIGANAAATRASLVSAINGVADPTVVPGTGALGAVANLVATDAGPGVIAVVSAQTRGGTPRGMALAGALAETMAAGGNGPWDVANLNESGGRNEGAQQVAVGSITVTAEMRTAGGKTVALSFTPTAFVADTRVGGVLTDRNEAVAISGDGIRVTMAGGVAPNFQVGDVVSFVAVA